MVAAAQFKMLPPPPPLPAVYISDLPVVKGTTGLGDPPKLNRSITDKPISVAGRVYEKGVGVHSYSELEYELRPEYRRFVAVVGVDDAMKDFSTSQCHLQGLSFEGGGWPARSRPPWPM